MKTLEGDPAIESSVTDSVTRMCPHDPLYVAVTVVVTVMEEPHPVPGGLGDPWHQRDPNLSLTIAVPLGLTGHLRVMVVHQDLRVPHLPLPQLLLFIRKTLALEPGDPDHPHHGAHDDGPHSEEAELSRSVTLVGGTKVRPLVSLRLGGGEDVWVAFNNTEIKKLRSVNRSI